MKIGQYCQRNVVGTSNWSNFGRLSRRAGLSAISVLSCFVSWLLGTHRRICMSSLRLLADLLLLCKKPFLLILRRIVKPQCKLYCRYSSNISVDKASSQRQSSAMSWTTPNYHRKQCVCLKTWNRCGHRWKNWQLSSLPHTRWYAITFKHTVIASSNSEVDKFYAIMFVQDHKRSSLAPGCRWPSGEWINSVKALKFKCNMKHI